jgi:two-component system alkaline phosphatase synthesis response regulator PhoP
MSVLHCMPMNPFETGPIMSTKRDKGRDAEAWRLQQMPQAAPVDSATALRAIQSRSVLIVEDDPDIAELVRSRLEQHELSCLVAQDGPDALRLADQERPALILLDLMLPHMDGLQVLRVLKQQPGTANIPVIIITARAAEEERVEGLRQGAVDYITKPFSIRELAARVQNMLKLTHQHDPSIISVGTLRLDLNRYRVFGPAGSADLTATEFKLLWAMARRPGRVFTRDELLNRVWGSGVVVTDRTVDVHMRRIREKMRECGLDPRSIGTVRGVGYRLAESA